MKTAYICEGCKEEFEDYGDCDRHETKCTNKHLKYRKNVEEAVGRVLKEYGNIISEYTFGVDEDIPCFDMFNDIDVYKFDIKIHLSNGNKVSLYDGCDDDLWLGNYLEADTIYKSLKREIESGIPLEYEGILHWEGFSDDGYSGNIQKLGDIEVSTILDRLDGRKVKISVIE